MVSTRGAFGRFVYAAFFCVVLPAALVLWANATASHVSLAAVRSAPVGAAITMCGVLLMSSGIAALITRGGGLPINMAPPPRYVRSGIFAWIRNPIYIGFGLVCAGVSMYFGSASGLWLVTPLVSLAAAALAYGYELPNLIGRFGAEAAHPPRLSLPRGDDVLPTVSQRVAVYLWVFVPWLVTYYAVQALGRAPDAFTNNLPFETHFPVLQWTELLYVSAYVFIGMTPLVVRTQRELRRFAVRTLIGLIIVAPVWLAVPVVTSNRPFEPQHLLGALLAFEQQTSAGVAAFPAFHVLWSLIAAQAWSANDRTPGRHVWTWVGWSWALLITASCVTTAMHTLVDVLAALPVFLILRNYGATLEVTRRAAERIANSWREWRIGSVRLMGHAVWAALGMGVGVVVAGAAADRNYTGAVIWVAFCALVGAGLWGQAVEGSSRLLRPFGWYGGLIGGAAGALMTSFTGTPLLTLIAAFSVAAPWVQALGRLRCLVQGCCHGGPAPERIGIRYLHPRSRVTQLSALAGTPIHATPVYSILANVFIGVALIRLRTLATPESLLPGIYLVLSGIARFVEESFRAEPQTIVVGGLHSYHWMAMASVVIGIGVTMIPAARPPMAFVAPKLVLILGSIGLALLAGFAMGVDFPTSNRRFSRLASAE